MTKRIGQTKVSPWVGCVCSWKSGRLRDFAGLVMYRVCRKLLKQGLLLFVPQSSQLTPNPIKTLIGEGQNVQAHPHKYASCAITLHYGFWFNCSVKQHCSPWPNMSVTSTCFTLSNADSFLHHLTHTLPTHKHTQFLQPAKPNYSAPASLCQRVMSPTERQWDCWPDAWGRSRWQGRQNKERRKLKED